MGWAKFGEVLGLEHTSLPQYSGVVERDTKKSTDADD
jgi:hypothetical protein